jgi:hypothetical protein
MASHPLDDASFYKPGYQHLDVMFGDSYILGDPLIGGKTAICPPADIPGE